MPAKVPMEEVAQLLRSVISGDLALKLAKPELTWDRVYAGDVGFLIGDWRVSFFNDCDELDYTSGVTAPDGRESEFDDWCDEENIQCPLDLLTGDEHAALELLVSKAV